MIREEIEKKLLFAKSKLADQLIERDRCKTMLNSMDKNISVSKEVITQLKFSLDILSTYETEYEKAHEPTVDQ